jgi:hypothetical protein
MAREARHGRAIVQPSRARAVCLLAFVRASGRAEPDAPTSAPRKPIGGADLGRGFVIAAAGGSFSARGRGRERLVRAAYPGAR